jgi:hypothetical protein
MVRAQFQAKDASGSLRAAGPGSPNIDAYFGSRDATAAPARAHWISPATTTSAKSCTSAPRMRSSAGSCSTS